MHRFKQFSIIKEDLDKLNYNKANENAFVLGLLGDIDDKIGSVQTEISLDTRSNFRIRKVSIVVSIFF